MPTKIHLSRPRGSRKRFAAFTSAALLLPACGAQASPPSEQTSESTPSGMGDPDARETRSTMRITIGGRAFTVSLSNNDTAAAFKARLPFTEKMTDLNGNEKYVRLSGKLPSKPSKPGTIHVGDLMLYGSDTIVLFYTTFSTSYSYTRIGKVDDVSGLATALGSGAVTVSFDL